MIAVSWLRDDHSVTHALCAPFMLTTCIPCTHTNLNALKLILVSALSHFSLHSCEFQRFKSMKHYFKKDL